MGYPMYYSSGLEAGHLLGWGIVGILLVVLFWVVVISIIVRLIRGPRWARWHDMKHWRDMGPMGQSDSALNILKERYAKGEIGKEEFETKKKDILGQ